MKAIKYFALAAACLLPAACEKTEWDVYTPNPTELYGNNSITEDNIVSIAQLKQMSLPAPMRTRSSTAT